MLERWHSFHRADRRRAGAAGAAAVEPPRPGALDVVIDRGRASAPARTRRRGCRWSCWSAHAGRPDRRLGLRQRHPRDGRGEARLGAGAGLRHRARRRSRRPRGARANGVSWRSRAATCAGAAGRRPCSRTWSGRCCWRWPSRQDAVARADDHLGPASCPRSTRSSPPSAPQPDRARAAGRRGWARAASSEAAVITFDDVQAAARRLDGVAHRTPVSLACARRGHRGGGCFSRPRTCSGWARSSSAAPTTRSPR